MMLVECLRCLYTTENYPGLTFDEAGVCSSCIKYEKERQYRIKAQPEGQFELNRIIEGIRKAKERRKYDCVIGLSGGVDSSYVAYLLKKAHLNPLAVHFDNGWNTDISTRNISLIVEKLEIDLKTVVVDWSEFRSLQIAFLRSSTPDGEIPSDHAIQACMWSMAAEHGIKFVFSGMNYATESTTSPPHWAYGHNDWRYINDINKKYGSMKLQSYPHYTLPKLFYWHFLKGIRVVSPLNYIGYSREDAKKVLAQELGWIDYGGKHHESSYTKFFQEFILPTKFDINKAIAHLSDLIRIGEISKVEAKLVLQERSNIKAELKNDIRYLLKKLQLSEEEFNDILLSPPRSYMEFKNNSKYIKTLKGIVNMARKWSLLAK
jgi:N-acetyl sugar amidotransferase